MGRPLPRRWILACAHPHVFNGCAAASVRSRIVSSPSDPLEICLRCETGRQTEGYGHVRGYKMV